MSTGVLAAWQTVASEQGRRVEIERDSVVVKADGEVSARGRIVLDKAIVDPRTSTPYRIIEITNRFDCNERTLATLKRAYYKENGDLLRQEDVRIPENMPVRSGTPDDRLFREACRPEASAPGRTLSASQAVEKANEAAAGLRQLNDAMVEKAVRREGRKEARSSVAGADVASTIRNRHANSGTQLGSPSPVVWDYEGAGGPESWGRLRPEYAVCATGRRQSPIDIRDGIAVDQEPIQFAYRPAPFKVVDGGRSLLVVVYGGGFSLLGKNYALSQIQIHRPAETRVDGRSFDMELQLWHRADDGKQAVVSILLEPGAENPVIQTVLNNLPLERGAEVAPPSTFLDIEHLLPTGRGYYAFMGSRTTPPCTEDVLWLVLKDRQSISSEQLSIFRRLYPPNARPVQPSFGRIVKESR